MKVYLVEAYSPSLKLNNDSLIIALTPEACYQLDKAGIEYSIIEDYYSAADLKATEEECRHAHSQWMAELDGLLQDNVTELKESDLELASIYYYPIMRAVLFPIYVHCHTLSRLFEAVKPSSIVFISRPPLLPLSLGFHLWDNNSYYSQIIPILCRERGILLELIHLRYAEEKQPVVISGFARRVKRHLGKSATIRGMYSMARFIWEYYNGKESPEQFGKDAKNVLLFGGSSGVGNSFIIDKMKAGLNVYQLNSNSVVKYNRFGQREYFSLEPSPSIPGSTWRNVADLLEDCKLIKEFSKVCKIDVSELILPKLRYFIAGVCPSLYAYFKTSSTFYEESKIDSVLASVAVTPTEIAARYAANRKGIEVVCICHGDEAFMSNWWRSMELQSSDILIATNTEAAQNYRQLCKEINAHTRVFANPYRLSGMEKIRQLREGRDG